MLWMRREPGIVDAFYPGMAFKKTCQGERVAIVTLDPKCKCAETSQE
jgi:hypothetical protein